MAIKRSGTFEGIAKNSNEAEMWAASNGILHAIREGADAILIQSDSLAVVHGVLGVGRSHPRMWVQTFNAMLNARGITMPQMDARHVKGHSGVNDSRSYVNRWCDHEARRLMREARTRTLVLKGIKQ